VSLEILHRQFHNLPDLFFYQCSSYVFTLTLLFRPIFSFLYFTTYRYETWSFFPLIAHSTAPGLECLVFLKPLQLLRTVALPILNFLLSSKYINAHMRFTCLQFCLLCTPLHHLSFLFLLK
jgi:hypothetical protein